tara:strand:+ start:745 stop:1053 length:309 start_codon:yes stop_codon:yes gene_type:complete
MYLFRTLALFLIEMQRNLASWYLFFNILPSLFAKFNFNFAQTSGEGIQSTKAVMYRYAMHTAGRALAGSFRGLLSRINCQSYLYSALFNLNSTGEIRGMQKE